MRRWRFTERVLVTRGFRAGAGFVASLDRGCRELVNRNGATGLESTKPGHAVAEE
jgi:cullin 1